MEFRGYRDHIRDDGDVIAATALRGLDRRVPDDGLKRQGDESRIALLRSRLAAATR